MMPMIRAGVGLVAAAVAARGRRRSRAPPWRRPPRRTGESTSVMPPQNTMPTRPMRPSTSAVVADGWFGRGRARRSRRAAARTAPGRRAAGRTAAGRRAAGRRWAAAGRRAAALGGRLLAVGLLPGLAALPYGFWPYAAAAPGAPYGFCVRPAVGLVRRRRRGLASAGGSWPGSGRARWPESSGCSRVHPGRLGGQPGVDRRRPAPRLDVVGGAGGRGPTSGPARPAARRRGRGRRASWRTGRPAASRTAAGRRRPARPWRRPRAASGSGTEVRSE